MPLPSPAPVAGRGPGPRVKSGEAVNAEVVGEGRNEWPAAGPESVVASSPVCCAVTWAKEKYPLLPLATYVWQESWPKQGHESRTAGPAPSLLQPLLGSPVEPTLTVGRG